MDIEERGFGDDQSHISCETYHKSYEAGLFTEDQCNECSHKTDKQCPTTIFWKFDQDSENDYMCVFINCVLKSLSDKGEYYTTWRLAAEGLGILLMIILFYLAINLLFKDYLKSKPSYRLLGLMLLFQAAYINDLFMQEYQENLIQGAFNQVKYTFNPT